MSLFKKRKKVVPEKTTAHFIFVEEPLEKVASEVMKWEESLWWPEKSAIHVTRKTPNSFEAGTLFNYKFAFFPKWTAEVTRFVPNRLFVNTVKSKMLEGAETVRIEERANGTKVEYEFCYRVKGLLYTVLWAVFGHKAYSDGMMKILANFKIYIIEKTKQEQEKKFEGNP